VLEGGPTAAATLHGLWHLQIYLRAHEPPRAAMDDSSFALLESQRLPMSKGYKR